MFYIHQNPVMDNRSFLINKTAWLDFQHGHRPPVNVTEPADIKPQFQEIGL